MLRAIAEYSKNDRAEFIKAVTDAQETQQNSDIVKKKKRLATAQKRASELETVTARAVLKRHSRSKSSLILLVDTFPLASVKWNYPQKNKKKPASARNARTGFIRII